MSQRTVYVKPKIGAMDVFAVVFCLAAGTLIVLSQFYPDTWARLTSRPAPIIQTIPTPAPAARPVAPPPALPTAQPAPVVLPVQDSAPAPVVQPQPAEAPAPVIIIHRIEASGAQVVTGSGACAAARSVARRCGK